MENGSGYFKRLENYDEFRFVKKKNRERKVLMNNNGIKLNIFIKSNSYTRFIL